MSRESEFYRDNLARVIERYPGHELLNKKEVSDFLGKDTRTICKMVPFNKEGYVSVATLARCISRGEVSR